MKSFEKLLSGSDLRSIGESNVLVSLVNDQNNFDELFKCLFYEDRLVVMRAADAIEKVTIKNPEYLNNHKKEILGLINHSDNKELKWHIAQLLPRLQLTAKELKLVWNSLIAWLDDQSNSRIVRVNSLQGLFDLSKKDSNLKESLKTVFLNIEKENIPSLNARIRKLRKQALKG